MGILTEAVREKNYTLVAALLEGEYKNSPLVNEADESGYTPVHFAARLGLTRMVSLLAAAGANLNVATSLGLTPLYFAAVHNFEYVIEALVVGGAQVDQIIKDDTTAVFSAAENGSARALKALIEAKANLNIRRSWDRATPAFIAADYGYLACVELLMQAGADFSLATLDSQTPLEAAKHRKHTQIVAFLQPQTLMQKVQEVTETLKNLSITNNDAVNQVVASAAEIPADSLHINPNLRVNASKEQLPTIINNAIYQAFNIKSGDYYHAVTATQADQLLQLGNPGVFLVRPGVNSDTIAISYLNLKRKREDVVIKTNGPMMAPNALGNLLQHYKTRLITPIAVPVAKQNTQKVVVNI